jgi:hypothetical protein
MVTEIKSLNPSLYDKDYHLWILETLNCLEKQNFQNLDLAHLIEEIEGLSRRDKRKLESLLTRLLEHLLKLKYWQTERDDNQGHWQGEIAVFRVQIQRELKTSPSLKGYLKEIFPQCYQDARYIVSQKTKLTLDQLPADVTTALGDLEVILSPDWLP